MSDKCQAADQANPHFPGEAGTTASQKVADRLRQAASRALAEAAERRAAADAEAARLSPPVERDGRGGLDPVRYGDWEVKGILSDF